MEIVLASTSKFKSDILSRCHIKHKCMSIDYEENSNENDYKKYVMELALGKAECLRNEVNGIIIGIAVGAQPIIGFNYGAKRLDRVRETFITSIKICFVVGIAATFVFQVFPEQITSLFGSESALYNEFSVKCFRIYLLLAVCNTFQIACSIFFQSLGKTKKSIICSLSRQILFLVPSILILSKLFGIEGLLWACPVADLLAFIVTGALFIFEYKHLKEHRKGINL